MVTISAEVVSSITAMLERSGDRETCGLLFGTGGTDGIHVKAIAFVPNVKRGRASFAITHAAYDSVLARHGRESFLGIFHSHPAGVELSQADLAGVRASRFIWLVGTLKPAFALTCARLDPKTNKITQLETQVS